MAFKDIAIALIPPQDNDPKVTMWRWLMWVLVMSLILVVVYLVANIAKGAEIDEIRKDVDSLRGEVQDGKKAALESQIFQKSLDVCQSSGQLRNAHNSELSRLVREWRDLVQNESANPPTLKTCQELGLAGN